MRQIASLTKMHLLLLLAFLSASVLPGLIECNPNEAMQIGADLGSPVVEPAPPKFTGLIESVRLFSGEHKP